MKIAKNKIKNIKSIDDARRELEINERIYAQSHDLRVDQSTNQNMLGTLFAKKKIGEFNFAQEVSNSLKITQTTIPPEKYIVRFQNLENLLYLLGDAYRLGHNVAECGVFKGLSAHVAAKFLRTCFPQFDPSTVHLFDSFAGFEEFTREDISVQRDASGNEGMKIGYLPVSDPLREEKVRTVFSDFGGINIYGGFLKDTLPALPEDLMFSFVHIDVDLYNATREALDFFYPRVVPGGVIVCDDYHTGIFPGAMRAWNEFMIENNETFTALPTSQAVWRRRPA